MKEKKKYINDFNNLIKVAFIPMIIITITEIYFKLTAYGISGLYLFNSSSYIFTIAIGYLIFFNMICLTKSTYKTTIIYCIINYVFFVINAIKIKYTQTPISLFDFNFLENASNLFELISYSLVEIIIQKLIFFISLLVIFILIIVWSKKLNVKIENKKLRISFSIITLIIYLLLLLPNSYTKPFYLKTFFDIDNVENYESYTNSLGYYATYGMFTGMYGELLNNYYSEPENYDEKLLDNELSKYDNKEENLNSIGNPNIILVFSESFWDINQQEDVIFDTQITSNYNKLKEEGKLVNLISPSYGGMSENVAFELLTGGNMSYFTEGYIPIMSLYNRNNSSNIPSLIKELKNNNYYTKIAFGKDYYNSKNTYLKMGFNEYEEYIENEENIKGNFISDEYAINQIIKQLQNKNKNEKIFYLLETIENHMPYTKNKYENYDIKISSTNLSEDMNEVLLSYAQGIYNADKQLGKLYDFIQTYDEDTIIIFLGDHLPYLYTSKNKNVINYMEFFNTEDELLNYYRKYNTQALILSNYNISSYNPPKYMGNDNILVNLINNMDIEISNYYKWINSTIDILPSSNKYISIDQNRNIYETNKLPNKMKEIYDLKNMMQYRYFLKDK